MSAIWPTREERVAAAQALRSQGFLLREIATELGIAKATVGQLLDPNYLVKQKRRRLRYRGTCIDCGRATDGSNGRHSPAKRCQECAAAKQHNERYWTPERVLAAIQRFANEHGRPPVSTEWLSGHHGQTGDGYPYTSVVLREFGSWAEAIETAGFGRPTVGHNLYGNKNGRYGPRISTEAYISGLRELSVDGIAPSSGDYGGLWEMLRRRGFTWAEACAAAGVRPRGRPRDFQRALTRVRATR